MIGLKRAMQRLRQFPLVAQYGEEVLDRMGAVHPLRHGGRMERVRRSPRRTSLSMAGQVERNETAVFRESSLQLMTKNTAAKRIAMDQQHRYFALATFLNGEGAVRCVDNLLPSRDAHSAISR